MFSFGPQPLFCVGGVFPLIPGILLGRWNADANRSKIAGPYIRLPDLGRVVRLLPNSLASWVVCSYFVPNGKPKVNFMLDADVPEFKTHYICQTYTVNKNGLKVDKLLQYTSASQAEERAAREARAEACAGADAYMLTEDPNSGEVSQPMFLARHGNVPEADAF